MVHLRRYRTADAPALAAILHAAVHRIAARHYTPAQCAAWSPAPMPAGMYDARVDDGRTVIVASDADDTPIGFIELEQGGHIDCFYCHPDAVGTGVGRALYAEAEELALSSGLETLHVEASESALGFFQRAGFRTTARRDFERNGVTLHNYAMEKRLEHPGA